MIDKLKKNKFQIIELITIFILTLLFNLICNEMNHDEVWVYGFSYNISNGMIPYKDFNMVITPLYPYLGSLFLLILGKNIISFHIFNSLICTMIFYYIKKETPKAYYIVYGIFLLFSLPTYNLLCLLLTFILMDLEEKKNNDYLIGLLLGITFLTKQNIGIYLCVPTLFVKDIKKIIKRIIGFIIPNIILLIYLIYSNTLYNFIDYAFLGIGDFANENLTIHTSCLIISILSIVYLLYKYIKTKDIKIIYMLGIQGMAYPLIDPNHVMTPFIVSLTDFFNKIKLNKKIISGAFLLFIIGIFSYNIYQYNTEKYSYPNNSTSFKYRKIGTLETNKLYTVKNYIKNIEGNVFIIDMAAYLVKLESNIPINKYDLLNNGNIGKNGAKKIIDEIDETCSKEKCTFLINEYEIGKRISQYNQNILKYVVNNYRYIKHEQIDQIGLSIFANY